MEVTDPTVVFLLIALGLAGIGIEILTPGGIIPALVGVVAMVFGVIGLLDVGSVTAGIAFLFLSVGFFISATAFRDYRVLSVLGVVSLIAAGVFMFNRSNEPTSIPVVVVGAMVVGGFVMFVIERANLAKSEPIRSGPEQLVGMAAEVRESLSPTGQVFVDGGLWKARLDEDGESARVGEDVRIVAIDGLVDEACADPLEEVLDRRLRDAVQERPVEGAPEAPQGGSVARADRDLRPVGADRRQLEVRLERGEDRIRPGRLPGHRQQRRAAEVRRLADLDLDPLLDPVPAAEPDLREEPIALRVGGLGDTGEPARGIAEERRLDASEGDREVEVVPDEHVWSIPRPTEASGGRSAHERRDPRPGVRRAPRGSLVAFASVSHGHWGVPS